MTLLLALFACKGGPSDDTAPLDDTAVDDTGEPVIEGCHATPAAADRDRRVVFSLPYDAGGGQSPAWGGVVLTAEGDLVDDGLRFELGRAYSGRAVFTPDGAFGYTPNDDGTIGVFAVEDDLSVRVIEPRLDTAAYAGPLVMHPSGEWLFAVDTNWPNNGGGVYRLPIDCDTGALGEATRVIASKNAHAMVMLGGTNALVAAYEVDGSEPGHDLHLLDLDAGAALGGADLFPDDEQIVSDIALAAGGHHVFVSDHSEFSGLPTRVAAAAHYRGAVELVQTVEVRDPVALAASPFDDGLAALSGYGNALMLMAYEPTGAPPLGDAGPISYSGRAPQLPSAMDQVRRGGLAGMLLVTEVGGLRRTQLTEGGAVTDRGVTSLGSGYAAMPGAVGVQP